MRTFRFFLFGAGVAFVGCNLIDPVAPPNDTPHPSIEMIDEAEALAAVPADAAEIEAVSLQGTFLTLSIRYGGGCSNHDFRLYGGNHFVETAPAGGEVWLSHDANGDACEALLERELTFDIRPLERRYRQLYGDHGAFQVNVHEPTGEPGVFQHITAPSPLYEL